MWVRQMDWRWRGRASVLATGRAGAQARVCVWAGGGVNDDEQLVREKSKSRRRGRCADPRRVGRAMCVMGDAEWGDGNDNQKTKGRGRMRVGE